MQQEYETRLCDEAYTYVSPHRRRHGSSVKLGLTDENCRESEKE